MPKQVDHAQRRRTIIEALWRLIITGGIESVSLRQVAAEAGVSMGQVQHYFDSKESMLRHALEAMSARVGDRMGAAYAAADGVRARIRAMLVETLPLDETRRTEALVGFAFLMRATVDSHTARHLRDGWRQGHEHLTGMLAEATTADPATEATLLLSVVDGLALHTLAGHHTAATALAALDAELARIFGGNDSGA
ncbi:Transcriptional regulator, TetR family [Alloactinosynnema sp. L-07]|uniref:TetR/AcrR family transcriptional regulator n=1 Tax=Alloactinosynnema sp. L-07 TaxID=1653480 RepID=UPI00065F0488|nr:TetR/AcrR family transcriptional regulator [Alloactinosynnema sp. L-07]CRK56441.1 Transcriptional regulator, TetR family [Alloactinosynnema sp. L-07]